MPGVRQFNANSSAGSDVVIAEREHRIDQIMPLALLAQLHLQAIGEEGAEYLRKVLSATPEFVAFLKDFVAKGGWILDWDEASRRAREEGKPIFAYFTRSYSY